MWVFCDQKASTPQVKGLKVTSCQSWRSQEKICHLAPATLEPVSPSSTASGIKSFSKFDRQQLCSPLTYRPHIYSINRSKPFKKVCQISRLCCLLLGPLWQLKVPLVYFINSQKGGLDCTLLYILAGQPNYLKWLQCKFFGSSLNERNSI